MPGMRCAVAVCNNSFKNAKKKGLNISFHSFPKNEKLRKHWIKQCRRSDLFNPNTSYVCSNHFRKEDYELSFQMELIGIPKKKYLIKTAFPLINLESSITEGGSYEISNIQERKRVTEEVVCEPELITSNVEISSKTFPLNNASIIQSEESLKVKYQKCLMHDQSLKPRSIESKAEISSKILPQKNIVCINEFQSEESLEVKYQKLLKQHETLKDKYERILENHRSLENESKQLKSKVGKISEELKIEQKSGRLLKNVLNTSFSAAQIQLLTRNRKRVHWSDEDISKAFAIRRLSKRCYLYLRNILKYPLPHVDTFKKKGIKINSS